ncbi:hypothetical protein GUJ93_ZPchr0030g33467 [Zizania palustris]|uniref:Uncharacterized protein n=1 Tax=Zizania palustris TaxID=103762 RepID=A0A8J5VBG0_ZIZPA|nr:hypothetical protein GUJ93_ZPchr0030g33467 [Zizania palustris]
MSGRTPNFVGPAIAIGVPHAIVGHAQPLVDLRGQGVVLAIVALLMSSTKPSRVPLRPPDLTLSRPPPLLQIHHVLSALLHAHALEDTASAIVF